MIGLTIPPLCNKFYTVALPSISHVKVIDNGEKFKIKMVNKQQKSKHKPQINWEKIQNAQDIAIEAKKYSTWSLNRKRMLDKAANLCLEGYGLNKKQAKKEWLKLGTLIWGLGGLKNINITGLSSLIASIVKQGINIIMPFLGTYIDIPLPIIMSNLSKYGMPIFDDSIKNSPTYKVINKDYKSFLTDINQNIKTNNLTQENLANFKSTLTQIKQNNRKQNDNLQYALVGSSRSIVRIATTAILIGLLIGTGGISLPVNLAIMGIAQIVYMLACGIDNKAQNFHIIKCLLKRNCFLAEDGNIDKEKVSPLYISNIDIEKQQIRAIYTYNISVIQSKLDKCYGKYKISNNKQDKYNIHKEINILQHYKNELLREIDIYEGGEWKNLDPMGIIGKCLYDKKIKIKHAVKAGYNTTFAVEGQAIKNYAANIPSLVLSSTADGIRYGIPDTSAVPRTIAFSTIKPISGITSAIQRPFCSTAREVNRGSLTHDNDLNKSKDKYGYPITLNVTTKNGIKLNLFSYNHQSKRIIPLRKRFKRCIKGIGQSVAYVITLPYEIGKAKYLYSKCLKSLTKAQNM